MHFIFVNVQDLNLNLEIVIANHGNQRAITSIQSFPLYIRT